VLRQVGAKQQDGGPPGPSLDTPDLVKLVCRWLVNKIQILQINTASATTDLANKYCKFYNFLVNCGVQEYETICSLKRPYNILGPTSAAPYLRVNSINFLSVSFILFLSGGLSVSHL